MNVKLKKEGKDLFTKMELIVVFTNSNVAMEFLSSIIHASIITYVCTLMQLSQTLLSH
jgi:glycerol-3-phosphate responsive antiterminator